MEELLRGGSIQGTPALLLPYLIIVAILTAAPLMKLYNVSMVEKSLDVRFGSVLLGAHLLIVVTLWNTRYLGALLGYLFLLLLIWMLSPLFSVVQDWLTIKQLSDRDIARFRYMLSLDPNNANALIGLANAYLQAGKRDEAIAAYEKAKAIDPLHSGVVSSQLQRLVDGRVVKNIGKNGIKIVSQNDKLFNMDQQVTMNYTRKEDESDIPEL